jgi:hypothetical protein
MAFVYVSYDLPPKSKLFEYSELALVVLNKFRCMPGFRTVIGMRSVDNTSPNVIAALEYETVEQAHAVAMSAMAADQIRRLREIGCTNFQMKVYEQSPLIPRY